MGNEKSTLSGLDIDEKATEVTDFWLHYGASVQNSNPQKISVFISEPPLHYSANFGKPSPLEKATKNLMLHRHPCILRYISSWSKGGKFYLATEEAKPLVQVIDSQTTLQICIGLFSILRALIFLHEKALASHNNICSSSIYVTPEGNWKLGGLEYLCKFTEMTPTYFQKIKSYRYEKAVAPDEDITALLTSANPTAIDAYAFGILAEEILKMKNADDVPGLNEFKEFCKENLQNSDPSLRNKLSNLQKHQFFTHDFMKVHVFLEELPLRNETEKEEFFRNLIKQLRTFPENVVAEQLGKLLLSRIVLLDCTAKTHLLPYILKPRDENDPDNVNLFTTSTFKAFIVPKLIQIFCIRDASIRLLLLSHFRSFMHTFHANELKSKILPELLVGIKDTNDQLVSGTLNALAEIVLVLGAKTVIGGNRGKLFTDGRPNKIVSRKNQVVNKPVEDVETNLVAISNNAVNVNLPERPSPDGGEDKEESNQSVADEESMWSDWETQETSENKQQQPESVIVEEEIVIDKPSSNIIVDNKSLKLNDTTKYSKKAIIADISELDIKHSKPIQSENEVDFFTDMEPVIKKTQILRVEETVTSTSIFDIANLNNADVDDNVENNAWGDDLNDWGENS